MLLKNKSICGHLYSHSADQNFLRTEAESLLEHEYVLDVPIRSAEELIHELQIHLIELEVQNETLRQYSTTLEESRDRWTNFYDLAPIGYLTLSSQGLIVDINLTGADFLGEERSGLLRRRFAKLVAPDDRDNWHRYFVTVMRSDCKQICELGITQRDGSLLYVQFNSIRLLKEGSAIEVRIVLTDITFRKQAEESLRISAEELDELYNHAPCGYHSLDRNGLICRINDTELAWLGYARNEVVRKMKWLDLLTPTSQRVFLDTSSKLAQCGCISDLEFEMIRKDGTKLICHVNSTAIYDKQGHFLQNRSSLFDITERKEFEDKLRFQSEILKNISEGIFLIRANNDEIVYANPRFEQMFGYESGEIVGKHIRIFHVLSDIDPVQRILDINAAIVENGVWREEIQSVKKNGELFWCHVSASTYEHPEFGKVWVSIHKDITQRKLLEQELRESEQRAYLLERQGIVQAALDGFWIVNVNTGRIIEVNDTYCSMVGYSRQEIMSMNINELDVIETPDDTSDRIKRIVELGYDRFETCHRHKQGHLIGFQVSVSHSPNNGGVNFAFFHDISKRKQAEQFKQSILNSVSAEIAVLDQNGVIVAVNEPWRRFSMENSIEQDKPYPGTNIGDNYLTTCHTNSRTEMIQTHFVKHGIGAVQEGLLNSFSFEYPYQSAQLLRWFRMDVTPLGERLNDGVVIAHTDITNSKRAEEEVKQSREQLKRFIQQAPISVAMLDQNMNYLAVSGRWLNEYGMGHVSLNGLNHYKVHPNMPLEWESAHHRALAGDSVESSNDMWIRRDGSKRWFHWVVQPWIDENKKIGGIIITTENITDTKLLEIEISEHRKEMDQLQKLHVAAQTASAIAHEINQPLLAIASYNKAALMMMKSKKPDQDGICKAIEKSELQALRAGTSIRDLISFLNKKDFPVELLDLNSKIIKAVSKTKNERNLEFNLICELEETLPFVHANRIHVQKVLLNLIQNGLDAMQAANIPQPIFTITIRTSKDNNFAHMTIKDNGPGIKKEDFHRLFEPFYTTKAKGIGMGLAISRSLIEENGGQLWVEPEEETGATFHLTLPLAI